MNSSSVEEKATLAQLGKSETRYLLSVIVMSVTSTRNIT
jgi:hypothetical protein